MPVGIAVSCELLATMGTYISVHCLGVHLFLMAVPVSHTAFIITELLLLASGVLSDLLTTELTEMLVGVCRHLHTANVVALTV